MIATYLKGTGCGCLIVIFALFLLTTIGVSQFQGIWAIAFVAFAVGVPLFAGRFACKEEAETNRRKNAIEAERLRQAKRKEDADRQRENADRQERYEMDQQTKKERLQRHAQQAEEFKNSLQGSSSARLQSIAARLRDELTEAKRKLAHEERENQRALRENEGRDKDMYRRCANITDEAKDDVSLAEHRLRIVEDLL